MDPFHGGAELERVAKIMPGSLYTVAAPDGTMLKDYPYKHRSFRRMN